MVRTVSRPLMMAVTALIMFAATLLAIPASATNASGEEAPALEAVDDSYKFWAGMITSDLEVYLNDPAWSVDGASITGLQKPELDDDTRIFLDDGGIVLLIDRKRTDDLTFSYRWSVEETGETSNWAVVSVDVKPTKQIRVKQPRRLKIKLINPNKGRVHCLMGSNSEDTPDVTTTLKPESSRVFTNKHRHRTMYLYCSIGKYHAVLTDRKLRNLKV